MNINPQFTFDKNGNAIGVFITIDEWSELTNGLQIDLPQWQKDALDQELKGIESSPEQLVKWDDFKKEFLA